VTLRTVIPVVAGLSALSADSAHAERPRIERPAGPCFEIVAPPRHTDPNGPILIDRCTGKTRLLVRHDGERRRAGYRWVALAFEAAPHRPAAESLVQPRFDGQKCFVFSGRRYCEE
jgi:hypothetical protein